MIIYRETKERYLADVDANVLKSRLLEAFLSKTGSVPSDNYVWADEYSRFAAALSKAPVDDDVDVAIEYHITSAGRHRIDALLAGNDGASDTAVIVELKAWETAEASDAHNVVLCPSGGDPRRPHPCAQARRYKGLILRFNQDMQKEEIRLEAAAYLFNLRRRQPEPLEDARYAEVLSEARLFLADDITSFREFLGSIVPRKAMRDVFFVLEHGRLVPCDSLIERVSSMLDGNEAFELVDEQEVAFEFIRHALFRARGPLRRHVFVVEGGPGTGKSVIAVRLLAEMLKAKRMGYLVAPNAAFRETLINALTHGNRGYRDDGDAIIRSSWTFHDENYDDNSKYDIFIVDEAHRLKDRAFMYRGKDMVADMVRSARVVVFFIDEGQRVAWRDIGTVEHIRTTAQKFGAEFHEPFNLIAQFRCNGSNGYLNWIDDVLQIRETANFDNWGTGQYDFKVFDRASDLYEALRARNDENKARLIAGYSWQWPKKGRNRGTVVKHVQADGLSLPWNYEGENWATGEDAIEQVGCVHTSQGVEFDWLGVLIGTDLVYRDGKVIGDPTARAKNDSSLKGWKKDYKDAKGNAARQQAVLDKVQTIIKNTYKVLLTRGRKGCFVWCADGPLRDYLKQRLALVSARSTPRAQHK